MAELVSIQGHRYLKRNPLGVLGLSFITLGIYFFYWYYQINDELRRFEHDETISPVRSLMAIIFGWIIIVPPVSDKRPFTFTWIPVYQVQPIEIILVAGSFALVSLGVLLFAKFFPIIPMFDIKEGQVLKQRIQIGRVSVPGIIRE